MNDFLRVNAALDSLIESDHFDEEAAAVLIDFVKDAPVSSKITGRLSKRSVDKSSTIEGLTSEGVSVSLDEGGKKKTETKEIGPNIIRVGKYKVNLVRDNRIKITHFQDDQPWLPAKHMPSPYCLVFSSITRKPKGFGRISIYQKVLKVWGLEIGFREEVYEPIHGSSPRRVSARSFFVFF